MHAVFRDIRMSHNKFFAALIVTNNTIVDSIHYLLNLLIHWGSVKCQQSPFLFCSYFSVFAAFTEKRYTAKGSVVSWLLLRSILIAASLKARHVSLTVLIPIYVIDFESGRSAFVELQQSIRSCGVPTSRPMPTSTSWSCQQTNRRRPCKCESRCNRRATLQAKSVSVTVHQISV